MGLNRILYLAPQLQQLIQLKCMDYLLVLQLGKFLSAAILIIVPITIEKIKLHLLIRLYQDLLLVEAVSTYLDLIESLT